jgi:hypothetical protein
MFNDVIGLGGSLGINFHGYDATARRRAIFDNDQNVFQETFRLSYAILFSIFRIIDYFGKLYYS